MATTEVYKDDNKFPSCFVVQFERSREWLTLKELKKLKGQIDEMIQQYDNFRR